MRYCYITISKESCVLGWGCPCGILPHKLDWPWGLCWLMRHQQVWSKHKFDKHFCFDTVTLGAWFPRKKSVPSCWRGDVQENQGMAAQTDLQLCDWGHWERVSSQPSCCLEAERLMSPAASPTHGKAIGDSFCMDQNSKMRKAGQLGGGRMDLSQTTYFSFPKSVDFPDHTCTERLTGDQRGRWCQGMLYAYICLIKSILAKRCFHTHGRIMTYTKYGLWSRKIKKFGQRKTGRNVPHKWFKLPWGHDSGTLPLSLLVYLSTHTVLFFLLINICFIISHLFRNSFLHSQKSHSPCHWRLV